MERDASGGLPRAFPTASSSLRAPRPWSPQRSARRKSRHSCRSPSSISASRPRSSAMPSFDDLADLMDAGQFVNGRAVIDIRARVRHRVRTVALRRRRERPGRDPPRAVRARRRPRRRGDRARDDVRGDVRGGRPGRRDPVPADVGEDDFWLRPEARPRRSPTGRRQLVPVHLYGQMADVTSLAELARRHDLRLVEDAAQAHGASRDGLRAGDVRRGRSVLLLPLEEPRRDGRRRRARHGRRRARRARAGAPGARPDRQVPVGVRRLHVAAGRVPGRRALAQAPAPRGLERAATPGCARLRRGAQGIGDVRTPEAVAGAVHVWHLYTIRTAEPDALAAP